MPIDPKVDGVSNVGLFGFGYNPYSKISGADVVGTSIVLVNMPQLSLMVRVTGRGRNPECYIVGRSLHVLAEQRVGIALLPDCYEGGWPGGRILIRREMPKVQLA